MIRHSFAVLAMAACALLAFHPTQVHADIISTGFAGGNGQSGNMFDVNVLTVSGIEISQFDLNLDLGSWDLMLYTKSGTYVGSETTPSDWTLHETTLGLTSAGENQPTAWDISDLTLGPGIHSFYVNVANGTALNYTNGTAEGNLAASNADIEIFEGIGNQANFGGQFSPRVWNGNIIYEVVPEPTTWLPLCLLSMFVTCVRRKQR